MQGHETVSQVSRVVDVSQSTRQHSRDDYARVKGVDVSQAGRGQGWGCKPVRVRVDSE